MSDPTAPSTAWPAARPTGISPIQHPAWEEARNAILDLAAAGPVTAVIVGEPGTGKTWLLRELASSLSDHGFPTMMLMQGDLPMTLSSGAALLVDAASLMSDETRDLMLAQRHGVVVLAAADWTPAASPLLPSPAIIPLRLLAPDESAAFAAEWLHRSGLSDAVGARTLSRVAAASTGRVGTLVQSLAQAATAPPTVPVPEPVPVPQAAFVPAPLPARPSRRRLYRPALALSAIAAGLLLGWALMPARPPERIAQRPVLPPAPPAAVAEAATTPAAPLPPLRPAETPGPAPTVVADAAPPVPPSPLPAPSVPPPPLLHADTPAPALVTADAPAALSAPSPLPEPAPELDAALAPPALAAPLPPPVLSPAAPPRIASAPDPALLATIEPPARTLPAPTRGGPGLVLVAQRGDTLESLYGSVYRDRRAPPFATVLAANPRPFRPGAIVVFPEPPGGWQRVQR